MILSKPWRPNHNRRAVRTARKEIVRRMQLIVGRVLATRKTEDASLFLLMLIHMENLKGHPAIEGWMKSREFGRAIVMLKKYGFIDDQGLIVAGR